MESVRKTSDGAKTGLRILVVDDEDSVRRLIRDVLTRSGYKVTEAVDAFAAQDVAVTDGPFDLLITDFNMPDMDGMELVDWFLEKFPDKKVLVITGALARFVSAAGTKPEHPVLLKPFSAKELVGKVTDALADGVPTK